MGAKQDALVEVVEIIERHGLTIEEISRAVNGSRDFKTTQSSGILSRLFGYLGGIFVFAGLIVYVGMRWDDLGSAGRIILTLGSGFSIFLLALVCTADARFERAATPFFLLAAFLQPTGIVLMLREYGRSSDPAYGLMFMNGVMAVQQGFTFWAKDRTVLALTTTVFTVGFFAMAFDLLQIDHDLIGVVAGTSLVCVGWSLGRSRHKPIAGLAYFFGSITFLGASYDWLRHTSIEVVFVGLAGGAIFLSTVARSRTLLLVGTVALIGYIGNFIAEHFAHNLNAPLLLILIGFLLIGLGAVALKINSRYINQQEG